MVISISKYPEGYNIASGGRGSHVREEFSGHMLERMKQTLDNLISNGFTRMEIAFYLKLKKLKDEDSVSRLIESIYEGKKFSVVQKELIEGKLFDLIEMGYKTPGELSPYFKGFTPNEVFHHIVKSERGRRYMKGLIASIVSRYGVDSYAGLLAHLGMQLTRLTRSAPRPMKELIKEMGGLSNIKLENFLTPLAIVMLESSKDAHDLLIKIGWDISTSNLYRYSNGQLNERGERLVEDRIFKLFGMSFEKAKVKYLVNYLGDH